MLLLWEALRAAAVVRHRVVYRMCGSRPGAWGFHRRWINTVYGPRSYDELLLEDRGDDLRKWASS